MSASVNAAEGVRQGGIRLRLPATSANLGPGFDALGIAMGLYLTVEARVAAEFAIAATGRNAELCGRVQDNLLLDTYREVLTRAGREVQPLCLHVENEIPLGMGCGSSAAALLGGILLASHFGGLGWDVPRCLDEAYRREGHPDNVSACALGYMTAACGTDDGVSAVSLGQDLRWKLMVALPRAGLATVKARAMLPDRYSRADAVANVQRTGLLVAAITQGRGELLRVAMQDRMHQPYRMEACPLLAQLQGLAGEGGVLGVALSGAGPGVLLIVEGSAAEDAVVATIRRAAGDEALEILSTGIAGGVVVEALD